MGNKIILSRVENQIKMGNKITCRENGRTTMETPSIPIYIVLDHNVSCCPKQRKALLEDVICSSSDSSSGRSTASSISSSSQQRQHRENRNQDTNNAPSFSQTSYLLQKSPLPENTSKAIQVVLDWIEATNKKNVIQMYRFVDESAQFHFPDTDKTLPMRKFWNATVGVFQGIPDLTFSYSDIVEPTEGTIILTNYTGAGYHDEFFAFGDNPPIPPTGAYLTTDPVTLTVNVDLVRQRITRVIAVTIIKGGLAGPLGLYIKANKAFVRLQGEN